MRFPRKFLRYVGAEIEGASPLGSDSVPTGSPSNPTDNQVELRLSNVNGYPVQRVVVGLVAPAPCSAIAHMYVGEDTSETWFESDLAKVLYSGTFAYFDAPVLADNSNVHHRDTGSLEVCLVVEKPDDAPDGSYTFVIGGDVSCPA